MNSLKEAISITPTESGEAVTYSFDQTKSKDDTAVLKVQYIEFNKNYKITLSTSAKDKYGNNFQQAVELYFKAADKKADLVIRPSDIAVVIDKEGKKFTKIDFKVFNHGNYPAFIGSGKPIKIRMFGKNRYGYINTVDERSFQGLVENAALDVSWNIQTPISRVDPDYDNKNNVFELTLQISPDADIPTEHKANNEIKLVLLEGGKVNVILSDTELLKEQAKCYEDDGTTCAISNSQPASITEPNSDLVISPDDITARLSEFGDVLNGDTLNAIWLKIRNTGNTPAATQKGQPIYDVTGSIEKGEPIRIKFSGRERQGFTYSFEKMVNSVAEQQYIDLFIDLYDIGPAGHRYMQFFEVTIEVDPQKVVPNDDKYNNKIVISVTGTNKVKGASKCVKFNGGICTAVK